MTYRGVVKHVRYWRGVPHVWSTVYPFIGTLSSALAATDAQALLAADSKMCYGLSAGSGGAFQCELYSTATGGVPVATYTAFDHTNPAAWIAYPDTVWTGTGFTPEAETALLVEWAAGTSRTGKPIKLRKWYHSVPVSASASGATADVSTANVTALTTQATAIEGVLGGKGLALGSPKGVFATTATVSSFYSNHQMPRGRRRKALVTAGGRYQGPTIQVPSGIESD